LIVSYTLGLNGALVLESALSFLGFGIQDPTPTWGNMLAFANSFMFNHPWVPLVPGLPILLASLAINYVGDGLRDALDPKMRT
jgi:peptide/nickel transport system permease protein